MEVGIKFPDLDSVLRRVWTGHLMEISVKELIIEYHKEHICLGVGGTRVTYDIGNGLVAKIPLVGNSYNESEAAKSSSSDDLAQSVVVYERGVAILLMEKVTPVQSDDEIPTHLRRWAAKFDCSQVGWTQDGRLVAYDYA